VHSAEVDAKTVAEALIAIALERGEADRHKKPLSSSRVPTASA
jgi:hypothetical protein